MKTLWLILGRHCLLLTFWPWLTVVLCLSWMSPGSLEAAVRYRVQRFWPEDGGSARAIDLNDRGQILLHSTNIYVFTPGLGYEFVVWGGAESLNNAGQVVGQAGGYGAYLWTQAQGATALPGINGGVSEVGYDINNLGQIVGIGSDAAGNLKNVRWDGPTSVIDLTALPGWSSLGGVDGGALIKINDNGLMIGSIIFSKINPWQGAIFDGNKWILLGGLSGGTNYNYPLDINNKDEVVGSADTLPGGAGQRHPFHWSNGTIRDLGVLPPYPEGEARSINEDGQIVGSCYKGDVYGFIEDSRAVLWTPEGVIDLNSLVTNLPPGDQLMSARTINNVGQIICQGKLSNSLFLLTPIRSMVNPLINLLLAD